MGLKKGDLVKVTMEVQHAEENSIWVTMGSHTNADVLWVPTNGTDFAPLEKVEKKAYFADAEVGGEVWDIVKGGGYIVSVNETRPIDAPFTVEWKNGGFDDRPRCGCFRSEFGNQTLFYASDPIVHSLKKLLNRE